MQRFVFLLLPALILSASLFAQDGHKIEVTVKGFNQDKSYLAYHYGNKQYMEDTVNVDNGSFVFEGEDTLQGGIYLVVLPPKNQYFEIVVGDDQHFTVKTEMGNFVNSMKIKGSKENKIFYKDMKFLRKQRSQAKKLNKKKKKLEKGSDEYKKVTNKIQQIDKKVKAHRREIMEKHDDLLYAKVLRAMKEPEVPESPMLPSGSVDSTFEFRYYKSNYLKGIDFTDNRLVRTPIYHKKITTYIDDLTAQHPDSLVQAVDHVLQKAKQSDDLFKYTLITYLNKYAKSDIMGMDEVYVHLVENYYTDGDAYWVDSTQLSKLKTRASKLKPLLIDKKAPNLTLRDNEGKMRTLHNVDAPYTILYFFDPDCSHCQEVTPKMVDVYKKYKDDGVKVFAVNTQVEEKKWRNFIKDYNIQDWINVADLRARSNFRDTYDIRSTPKTFLLDEDKTIIGKRIGPKQVDKLLSKKLDQQAAKTEKSDK